MFDESPSRDLGDGCATRQPQGVGSEAYLNGTSQGPTTEDAWKDGHIIRARCAPLSPRKRGPSFEIAADDSSNIQTITPSLVPQFDFALSEALPPVPLHTCEEDQPYPWPH